MLKICVMLKQLFFDKTGTLTEGKLELSEIKLLNDNYSKEKSCQIAASLENQSSHPIANAITNYAADNNIEITEIHNFKNIPGKGIIGSINGIEYFAGNESLIKENNIDNIANYSNEGKSVVFIGDESGGNRNFNCCR